MKRDYSKDFKNSAQTVLRDYWKFIPFFLVALIVQSLFFSLFMIGDGVNDLYRKIVTDKYSYHYIVEGLTSEKYAEIVNNTMTSKQEKKRQVVKMKHETYKLAGQNYHRLYVTLKDDSESTERAFLNDVYRGMKTEKERAQISCSETPLKQLPDYIFSNNVLIVLLWLAVTGISIFLMICVYNVRISHYRFMYGVYMTCGAGFRKLVTGALFEMVTVFAVCTVPAYILSCIIINVVFSGTETEINYISGELIKAVISSLIVIGVSVILPMRKVSVSLPINLINKGGTAEYVTSPRRSANFITKHIKGFPIFYEMLSIKRFLKYYVMLIVMCIVFNSFFVVAIYAGDLANTVRNTRECAFVATADHLTDDMLAGMDKVDGVDYLEWEAYTYALSLLSFVEMEPDMVGLASSLTVENANGRAATYRFGIEGFNEVKLNTLLRRGLANVTGNPEELFAEGGANKVIISRSINGVDYYDIEMGDKITIARLTDEKKMKDLTAKDEMISVDDVYSRVYARDAADSTLYERYELEVCAILEYTEPQPNLILEISPEMYATMTGEYTIDEVRVFSFEEASEDDENKMYNKIADIMHFAKNGNLIRTYSSFTLNVASSTYVMSMFISIAALTLMGAPVLWLYSQKVFYEKREDEVTLLYRLGAGEKRLLGMFFTAGIFVAVIAFIVSVILSYAASLLMLTIVAWVLPMFGFKYSWMLTLNISPYTLLLSAAVCMICGFISSMSAYYSGRRERRKAEREYMRIKKQEKEMTK